MKNVRTKKASKSFDLKALKLAEREGQLSNLLIEDLIKIDVFYTNYSKFIEMPASL